MSKSAEGFLAFLVAIGEVGVIVYLILKLIWLWISGQII